MLSYTRAKREIKECRDIKVDACRFEGKYPLWHIDGFEVRHSLLTDGARAALWYYRNLVMCDTRIETPKTLREMDGVIMERVQIPNATETFWKCATTINGSVTSIKNPTTGYIEADGVDEMIIDDNILPPANCRILVRSAQQTR